MEPLWREVGSEGGEERRGIEVDRMDGQTD